MNSFWKITFLSKFTNVTMAIKPPRFDLIIILDFRFNEEAQGFQNAILFKFWMIGSIDILKQY